MIHSLPAGEPYLPREFARDGFIHCTKELDVLLLVANNFYKETPGEMLVLVIDESKVTAQIKYEAPMPPASSAPDTHLFPHIYGPLNREAIVEIRVTRRAAGGAFVSV
ncbi:MAG: DUF952 domain-containing protein [Chloroflexi bacterium]|nr:DUF952 domain-containing protein [Chloroflexota bacterium]